MAILKIIVRQIPHLSSSFVMFESFHDSTSVDISQTNHVPTTRGEDPGVLACNARLPKNESSRSLFTTCSVSDVSVNISHLGSVGQVRTGSAKQPFRCPSGCNLEIVSILQSDIEENVEDHSPALKAAIRRGDPRKGKGDCDRQPKHLSISDVTRNLVC